MGIDRVHARRLGGTTSVGSYASGVTFHPNGQLAGYTLANGVSFGMWQNIRGLPELWQHAGVVRDRYAYDANGNVTSITDEQGSAHRSMPLYDGLDRLRQAHGPWGAGSYTYDAVDNLVSSTVGSRHLTHGYDASNRLTSITGSLSSSIGYDANGNVSSRDGRVYRFDLGNRLRQGPTGTAYAYDGHGRRNLIVHPNNTYAHHVYTKDGRLRFSWTSGEAGRRYVYLGDRLIAETDQSQQATYSHTDALGSPVARTDSARQIVGQRTQYEPYGATVAGSAVPTRIGFTGHVNDADTGLVYMEQRYYEPLAGRFLSVDPVADGCEYRQQLQSICLREQQSVQVQGSRWALGARPPAIHQDVVGTAGAVSTALVETGCSSIGLELAASRFLIRGQLRSLRQGRSQSAQPNRKSHPYHRPARTERSCCSTGVPSLALRFRPICKTGVRRMLAKLSHAAIASKTRVQQTSPVGKPNSRSAN